MARVDQFGNPVGAPLFPGLDPGLDPEDEETSLTEQEISNPPKGWYLEWREDGPYWINTANQLYNPRTQMLQRAPNSDEWSYVPFNRNPDSRSYAQKVDDELARERFERQGGAGGQGISASINAAIRREELQHKREQDAIDNERKDADREDKRAHEQYLREKGEAAAQSKLASEEADRAEKRADREEARRWREEERAYKIIAGRKDDEERYRKAQYGYQQDALAQKERAQDRAYRQSQDELTRQFQRQTALGFVDGQPTLAGRAQALQERQYQDQLANAPQNFFNYTFRSRGYEPPALPRPPEEQRRSRTDRGRPPVEPYRPPQENLSPGVPGQYGVPGRPYQPGLGYTGNPRLGWSLLLPQDYPNGVVNANISNPQFLLPGQPPLPEELVPEDLLQEEDLLEEEVF